MYQENLQIHKYILIYATEITLLNFDTLLNDLHKSPEHKLTKA